MSELTSSSVSPKPAGDSAGTTASARPSAAAGQTSANAATALPALFDEAGVTVTTARIVAYGQAAPLKDAGSVRLFVDHRHLRFAIPILIAGLALGGYGIAISSAPAIALAFMLIVVSYLTWRFQTLRHRLYLVRSTGETEVLANSDVAFTGRVKAALEQALAAQPSSVAPATPPGQTPAA